MKIRIVECARSAKVLRATPRSFRHAPDPSARPHRVPACHGSSDRDFLPIPMDARVARYRYRMLDIKNFPLGRYALTASPAPPPPLPPLPPWRRSGPSGRCKFDYPSGKCVLPKAWFRRTLLLHHARIEARTRAEAALRPGPSAKRCYRSEGGGASTRRPWRSASTGMEPVSISSSYFSLTAPIASSSSGPWLAGGNSGASSAK
jgi:hypothetical protein